MKKIAMLVFVLCSNLVFAQQLTSWNEVRDEHIGQDLIVAGMVVRTYDSGKATFLNFAEDYKGTFTAVIFSDAACDFKVPPADFFLGRVVHVQGQVKKYKGALEIIVDGPQSISCADGTQVAVNPPVTGQYKVGDKFAAGVRFVSWNIENFFDHHDDPYRNEGNTRTVSESRMARLAVAINSMNADVIALQEVENRGLLEEFNRNYLNGLGYEVVLFEGNDKRGIDNAVLSRLPIEAVTSYRHSDYQDSNGVTRRFGRDLLRVSIGGDFNTDVYVVHFKSQSGGEKSDVKREAEAAKALAIIEAEVKLNPNYQFVIAGDFNEVPSEPSVKMFVDAGFVDSCAGTDKYTYNKKPYLSRIDFVLCSAKLAQKISFADIIQSMPGLSLKCVSDHYPVWVEFETKSEQNGEELR
ncbi:MAG: endonuclease/exonuclease/phosphatase family protein [Planctomycetota bacterium]|jgi:endonuclease/exonuclease/phosphatase family metal-dependent hydrolase|nr:endonuclease/exonuclease/phosphatase family protein [Planctomycetota bacterium]